MNPSMCVREREGENPDYYNGVTKSLPSSVFNSVTCELDIAHVGNMFTTKKTPNHQSWSYYFVDHPDQLFSTEDNLALYGLFGDA